MANTYQSSYTDWQTDFNGNELGSGHPREFSFDLGYSRKLGDKLSIALAGRYIYSNLASDNAANAWPQFHAAVNALGQITSDDPFGGVAQPAQLAKCAHPRARSETICSRRRE